MEENIIRFDNVSVSYGSNRDKVEVLQDFDLLIRKHAFVTLIGSSGCGKTTVLKLINGLLKPNAGKVYVRGQDLAVTDRIALRRSIGYVIQDIGLFPHMTVEKNITFVPRLEKGYDKEALKVRAAEMIEMVGLDPSMLRRYPDELSGGQRQRVGIARALINRQDILLMDEPFGAVDEITRHKLQDVILELHQQLKCTIVFVTHDIREALKLGTRTIIMDQGKILQAAAPEIIRRDPASEFVAELIGDHLL